MDNGLLSSFLQLGAGGPGVARIELVRKADGSLSLEKKFEEYNPILPLAWTEPIFHRFLEAGQEPSSVS
jgi:hypothetical protein